MTSISATATSATSATTRSRTPYFAIHRLSRGGMGTVDVVMRQEGAFRRLYAMKRLLPAVLEEPGFREMFLEEARLAGLLRHPNVVSVLDYGEDERGPYLVMDWVEGVPVSKLVGRPERPLVLPVQICLQIIIGACRGLHAAHVAVDHDGSALGLVHRDVSPQNILVGFDGTVRVADFGIAKARGASESGRTATGVLKGKMGYMAPERLRFETADHRADLFSVGVILFELLAGQRLYASKDNTQVARLVLSEPPPDIALIRDDVPPEVVEILFELLAKRAEDRPATAEVVADRLQLVLDQLVLAEGRVKLDELLATHLEATRRGLREAIDQGMKQARHEEASPSQPTTARSARPLLASAARVAGIAVIVVVALAAGYFLAERGQEPAASAPASPPPAAAPIAREPEERRYEERGADAVAPEPVLASPETSSVSSMAQPEPAPGRAMRRRAARPAMRQRSSTSARASAQPPRDEAPPVWTMY